MRRLGYLAANTGFAAAEIEAMSESTVGFWIAALSLHFEWLNEQNRG